MAQIRMTIGDPGDLFTILSVPFYAVIFMAIVKSSGRSDLFAYAAVAPVLLALWAMALNVSGELVARDRYTQVVELLVATPTPLPLILLARIAAVTVVSLLGFVEVLVIGRLLFGTALVIQAPLVFVTTLFCTAAATACTALLMSVTFALGRTPRVFQNTLTYPLYLLGGIMAPVSLLPAWLQPIARFVYLSWAADLLRDAVRSTTPPLVLPRMLAILALGSAALLVGWYCVRHVLRTLLREGRLGLT